MPRRVSKAAVVGALWILAQIWPQLTVTVPAFAEQVNELLVVSLDPRGPDGRFEQRHHEHLSLARSSHCVWSDERGLPVRARRMRIPTKCEDVAPAASVGQGMRTLLLWLAIAFAVALVGCGSSGPAPEPFVSGVPPAAAARFKKGINLGNRLEAPNEGDWGGVIQAEDFPFIAQRGFDHVRIPIRFSGHALAAPPYTIDAAFFSRVDAVLDQAAAANLAVVVDMHAYDELATDVAGNRDRLVALWTQIAARYQSRPDTVAFEVLNEPNGQLDTTWNDVMLPAIRAIRATNPRRLLIVDSVFWADPTRLSMLTLPDDANIIAAIHLYEPKLFSFQGQDWIGAAFLTTGVIFPGPPATPIEPVQAAKDAAWANQWFIDYNTQPAATNPSGPATVAAQIALITAYQQSQGRTVYNGEWGPQDGGALDSRVRLVTEVRQQCEAAGIGWAIWEDPSNMNLFDSLAGTWLSEIIDALLPP